MVADTVMLITHVPLGAITAGSVHVTTKATLWSQAPRPSSLTHTPVPKLSVTTTPIGEGLVLSVLVTVIV